MIHELKDPAKAEHLFAGWEETLIWSCLQGVMGSVFMVTSERKASVPSEPTMRCARISKGSS